jgi:hypothetical protein
VVVRFELRASCLLCGHFTTWTIPPALIIILKPKKWIKITKTLHLSYHLVVASTESVK